MNESRPKHFIAINSVCPGTFHSKMRQTKENTISVQDGADVIAYLATLRMEGIGDCSVPQADVPRGANLWHDLNYLSCDKIEKNFATTEEGIENMIKQHIYG